MLCRFDTHTDTETTTLTRTTISNFISEMNAKNLPQGKETVKNVVRCGKQLGCINSALNALISLVISHADATELKQNERQALEASLEWSKKLLRSRASVYRQTRHS